MGFIDTFRHLYPKKTQQFSFFSNRGVDMRKQNKGWRLDYALINKEDIDIVVDSSIHKEFVGSDHVPIQLKLDLTKVNTCLSPLT